MKNKNYLNSKKHRDEHSSWTGRRGFLKTLGLAGAGAISFGNSSLSVINSNFLTNALKNSYADRSLVLIRLKGGNDGLNTIIPVYDYDNYINKRPNIHIPNSNIIKLNDRFGIPNFMEDIQNVWKDGKMKVVHGVGYENPNGSHFKSSDIWASATRDPEISSGWLGRYYDEKYIDYLINPPKKPLAIQIGSRGNLIFNGSNTTYAFAVSSPERLKKVAENGTLFDTRNLPNCTHGDQLEFLRRISNATFSYASVIHEAYNNSEDFNQYNSKNSLDKQLSLVSRLIKGNLGTKIYMVSLGGFDTHGNQPDRHEQLLSTLSSSIKVFYDDLKYYGLDNKVLSVTFSEFGRRVAENGSMGTDHGTAAPIMLFGSALKGSGFVGNHPSLTDLNNRGNLKHSIDFRSIYTTLLTDWLCGDGQYINKAMLGKEYSLLGLGLNCNEDVIDFNNIIPYHAAIYSNNQVDLHLRINQDHHIKIYIYDTLGRNNGMIFNDLLRKGTHIFPLDRNMSQKSLSSGQYFYNIKIQGGNDLNKSFIVK